MDNKLINHSKIKNLPKKSFIEDLILNEKYNFQREDILALSDHAIIALENEIIQKALQKNKVSLSHILNISSYSLKALEYPTIKRCLNNKINGFFSRINLKEILEIKTEQQLNKLLKLNQKRIKRNPFFLFLVPVQIHDQIHELKKTLMNKEA